MPIIGTLPNNIQNGNTVDATPVMADFNFIVNQVNANANPIGTLTAPSSTRVVFHQAAAPVGWTIDPSLADFTMQLSGGTAAGTAVFTGNGYSGMYQAQWTTDGHALTIGELAAHTHTDSGHTHTDSGHNHVQNAATWYNVTGVNFSSGGAGFMGSATLGTQNAAANIQSSTANIQNTGSGTAHSHTKTFNVNYAVVIIGQKA
jgi:hypothetical protein